ACNDDGRAPDLDPLDRLAAAVDARVELGRPGDLGALGDLDLVPERDAAVAREMERERARGGTGGRVLCDTEPRPEHARLPASTVAREAVDTVRAEGLEALEVRPERDDLVHRAQRDVDLRNAVVVELDRQLRRNTE